MRQNPARRTALLDAAIEVLAQEGSRGLTLRAVDKAAGVPTGTTTNYFANRAELLRQIMGRTKERLTPDPAAMAETMKAEPSRELTATLLRQLVERMRADSSSHRAMLELRLESTRRPELQEDLTRTFTELLDDNINWHLDAGLPGDRDTVLLLYLAMLGVIVDDLTVPALLEPHGIDRIIDVLVERSAPGE
ncbi:TetR family transcriptional regulator [Streptomyces sp. LHD-70]|uniref:TetR/AcrR family transcriptional regulator n=1 Tax=Streptomyces sp. LHD-70 TaxID=3072140 RepID=UPI00280F3A34|nr:TetR family transcriptional regulator [Streptomyces sp. LHD-70]MDQ8704976.1 TetR family transcriptional regulator [Streptomyces sp. LHD-70]